MNSRVIRVAHPDAASSPAAGDRPASVFQPMLLRASAGTGKTYRLTGRLLRILLQGVPPETVLATTFTRKAAGEITSRLLVDLAKAADESNDDALGKLQQQLKLPSLPRSVCLQLLDSLLRNIHRLRICTLDSLFSQLAKSFPFEMNLPPAWRLTDEIEEVWFRERAVDAMIASLDRNEMSSILAMLGKGEVKRSVTRELLTVVNDAYSSGRGSAGDAWDKIRVNKQPIPAQIDQAIATFRSTKPKQKSLVAVLEKMATALEQGDFDSLAEETLIVNIAKARRSRSQVKFGNSFFPQGLDEAFDILYAGARSRSLDMLRLQNKATASILQSYDHHVTQMKFAARTIGFDDVAFRLAAEFNSLDHQTLASRMDGAINHILLDEFQDTSPVQWQVLRPLAQRVTDYSPNPHAPIEQESVERSFFCVGDTKQAIYGWRGGVAQIFDAVSDQLSDIVEDRMDTSFRSSPVVIQFVNDVFRNIATHPIGSTVSAKPSSKEDHVAFALHHFASNFPEHHTAKTGLRGYVRMETSQANSDPDDDNNFARAAAIAAQIHAAAPEKVIGILTRSNKGVAKVMRQLQACSVQASQEGGNPLTDSAAVELILSALMMSEHPGDRRWKFHTDHSPLADIPNFGPDLVRDLLTDRGLAEAVEFLADALTHVVDQRDAIRLKQLIQLAIGYHSNAAPRVRDFVRMVTEKRIERPQAAKIRVMTVHQSKGLEFDAVILPELEGQLARLDGRCVAKVDQPGDAPTSLTRYIGEKQWHFLASEWQQAFGQRVQQAIHEAICLLYVAITRARQAVYIIVQPATKKDYQNKHAAAMVYHALRGAACQCHDDPSQPGQTLYESGNQDWYKGESL